MRPHHALLPHSSSPPSLPSLSRSPSCTMLSLPPSPRLPLRTAGILTVLCTIAHVHRPLHHRRPPRCPRPHRSPSPRCSGPYHFARHVLARYPENGLARVTRQPGTTRTERRVTNRQHDQIVDAGFEFALFFCYFFLAFDQLDHASTVDHTHLLTFLNYCLTSVPHTPGLGRHLHISPLFPK